MVVPIYIYSIQEAKRKFKAALDSRARTCLREENKTGTEKKGGQEVGRE